jgi:hypothetical protein
MTSQIDIRTITVNQSEIDLENMDFHVPSFESLDPLVASIEQVGILHPPVVKRIAERRFIPVLGRRRLEAVFELKAHSLEVRVVDPSQTCDQTFIMAFWDNLERIKRDISVKAYVVKKLFELVPRDTLAKKIFPFLDVSSKGPKLERLKRIGGLERPLLSALSSGRLQEKSAAILSELPGVQRLSLMKLISGLGLNANKAFEVISHLFDLSIYLGEPITDMLSRPETEEIINDSRLTVTEKASQFRNLITKWAFPDITENRQVFDNWVQDIRPPRNVTLRPGQSFEDDSVTIEIRLDSRSKAEDFLNLTREFQPHDLYEKG